MPQIGPDSHLFVMLFGQTLSCLLVSADYAAVHSLSEHFSVQVPQDFGLDQLDNLLPSVLKLWGQPIGLKLAAPNARLDPVLMFDGKEIGGISLIVEPRYDIKDYRSSVLSVEPIVYGEKEQVKWGARYMEVISASDMIFVLLQWDSIAVLVFSREKKPETSLQVDEFRLENDTLADLSKTRIRSLMSVNIKHLDLQDHLSNFFARKTITSKSFEVHDILRSYVTASLFSFKDRCFSRFGIETEDAVLVVSGSLAAALPKEDLMLSVVDGLQLKGRYKIVLDRELRSIAGGMSFARRNFVMPITEVLQESYIYLSTEKGASGRVGRQAFRGKVTYCSGSCDDCTSKDGNTGSDDLLVGQTGQICTIDVSGIGSVLIKPDKYTYFPNLVRSGEYLRLDFTNDVVKVIIDCRKIPVIYGPDVLSNHRRLAEWRRGLSLSAYV
ncbi:MAG: hypothetical protein U9Q67_00590 [Patescibacteria group bacterium]|nr:hypothetical protein [Patescibacteria group bacterium]